MAESFLVQSVFGPSNKEHDDVFNYELVYLRYLEACANYFKTPKSITGPWTQEAKIHIINSIKVEKFVDYLLFNNSVYDLNAQVFEKYQVAFEDGEETLVLTGTAIEVLSYDECFDIFVEVHLKAEHGGFSLILKRMENAFKFEGTCLNIFLQNCNVCKKHSLQNITPAVFNDCISIEILKAPIQDFQCRFILFYHDNVTKFMLLRPLIAMDEYEIAIEMLKIFTDFGPPVVIKTIHSPLFNNVLTILQRGGFNYDISIHASDKVIGESYQLMEQIVKRSNRYSQYWSLICRFIQFKYNNGQLPTRDPILDKVVHVPRPFHQVFFTRHSNKEDSVSETPATVQENNQDSNSSKNKLCNLENTTEQSVINIDSSETDTASDSEGDMETDERFDFGKGLKQVVTNVTRIPSVECGVKLTPYNTALGNMDVESDHEIKIEFNPVEKASRSKAIEEQFRVSEVERVDRVKDKKNSPFIVDSIPVKEEPILKEFLTTSDAGSVTEALPFPGLNIKTETSTEHNSVKTTYTDDHKNERKYTDFCSSCNGKMLTDYICFECKKKTHIFCLSRVTKELLKISDPVISFTYCKDCLKSKTQ